MIAREDGFLLQGNNSLKKSESFFYLHLFKNIFIDKIFVSKYFIRYLDKLNSNYKMLQLKLSIC